MRTESIKGYEKPHMAPSKPLSLNMEFESKGGTHKISEQESLERLLEDNALISSLCLQS